MDPANRPSPFKRYRDLEREPLPTSLDPPDGAPTALEVLSGHRPPIRSAALDPAVIARLLYYSGGVTRYAQEGRRRSWFRANASAGNLHPLELYAACGAVSGLDSGLYHVDLDSFCLARVRPIDVRAHLAHAVGDPALAGTAVVIVITGIPWRTTWKYAERGWRHVFWDAGSLLANLLAVAEAHGVPAHLAFGFMDREVSHILGIDGTTECPVAVVAVGAPADERGRTAIPTEPSDLDELRLEVEPLSPTRWSSRSSPTPSTPPTSMPPKRWPVGGRPVPRTTVGGWGSPPRGPLSSPIMASCCGTRWRRSFCAVDPLASWRAGPSRRLPSRGC